MHITLDQLKARLRKCGLKLTPQRMAVLKVFSETRSHPDAKSIFERIRKQLPSLSLATIHCALKALDKYGVIQELGVCGDIRHFDARTDCHSHLICLCCGSIEDVEDKPRDFDPKRFLNARERRYDIIKTCLNFYGFCPKCRKKAVAVVK